MKIVSPASNFEWCVNSGPKERRKPVKSFIVKGLFTLLKFPYIHFSGTELSGDIFQLFWEIVKHLERIGLIVSWLHHR